MIEKRKTKEIEAKVDMNKASQENSKYRQAGKTNIKLRRAFKNGFKLSEKEKYSYKIINSTKSVRAERNIPFV